MKPPPFRRIVEFNAGMLSLAGMVFLFGCDEGTRTSSQPKTADALTIDGVTELEVGTPRFKIESHGKFRAGHDHGLREILTITDLDTGKHYLGITGVGITELRSETETSVTVDSEGHLATRTTTETKER